MKSIRIIVLLIAWNAGASILPPVASAQQATVSFQLFYDELSPYGTWVDYPNHGYVWFPNVEPGFSPYATAGHWVFTEVGWTWVSDYPWGWAAFHYGRWDYDDIQGWFWVPGNEWGPAWVSWRRSLGYYGWAPLRPGISVSIALGRDYRERNERWIFVRDGHITRSDVSRFYVNRADNAIIISNSVLIVATRNDSRRNVTYIAGPDRLDVQRVTHSVVNPIVIRENDRPGHHLSGGELHIFRPQVQVSVRNEHHIAPSQVLKLNEVRPLSERTKENRKQRLHTANPPARVEPSQLHTVNPPTRVQPSQPHTANPPTRVQPSQTGTAKLPTRVQPSQSGTVKSPATVRPSQPATAKSPTRVQPSQPGTVKSPATAKPSQPPSTDKSSKKKDEKQSPQR